MNNELLLLIEDYTDTLIGQTKSRPQGTLLFQLNTQTEIFPFSPPINLVEEGKWLLAVTYFEAIKFVYIITDRNNNFSNTTPSQSNSKDAEKTMGELFK